MAPNRSAVKNGQHADAADRIVFELDELSLDELEMLEEITGLPFDECLVEGKPKAKVMKAFACIVKRREDPEFTVEQAGALKIRFSNKPDPTKAAGES